MILYILYNIIFVDLLNLESCHKFNSGFANLDTFCQRLSYHIINNAMPAQRFISATSLIFSILRRAVRHETFTQRSRSKISFFKKEDSSITFHS